MRIRTFAMLASCVLLISSSSKPKVEDASPTADPTTIYLVLDKIVKATPDSVYTYEHTVDPVVTALGDAADPKPDGDLKTVPLEVESHEGQLVFLELAEGALEAGDTGAFLNRKSAYLHFQYSDAALENDFAQSEIITSQLSRGGPVAIPEAPTWLMFIIGFGIIGCLSRVRRRQRWRTALISARRADQ
jgi:hypothetical protein